MSGTSIAQAIGIAISPILSRMFSPSDFGVYGIYLAACSILAVFATGRYDLSIIEPKDESDAKILVVISLIIAAVFSSLILIIISVFHSYIANLLNNSEIVRFLYLIPFSLFILTSYNVILIWLNRKKYYREMSRNRIVNSTTVAVVSLGLGAAKFTSGGLIFGFVAGQMIAISSILKKMINEKFVFSRARSMVLMRRYSRYPKYLLPSTLAGELSSNGVTLIITAFFSAAIGGFFTFTNRVTALPISLIGNAIGEVYRQKAAEEYNRSGNCRQLFIGTLLQLTLIAIVPFVILFFFGEHLFTFIFGKEWIVSGQIARCFSFLIFFQLLSTPLSYTIVFNNSQKLDLLLQLFRGVFSIGAIFIGYLYSDYMLSIILYTIVFCLYYIMHSFIQYRAAIGIKS
jgi:O-antigen/teichoic acid export membrane protein